jgi:hypothetical protein
MLHPTHPRKTQLVVEESVKLPLREMEGENKTKAHVQALYQTYKLDTHALL